MPDAEMEAFIRVCGLAGGDVKELTEEEIARLRPNARVRITQGVLKGTEGYYQQVRRLGKRRVFIVKVDFLCGCATSMVKCDEIEYIE